MENVNRIIRVTAVMQKVRIDNIYNYLVKPPFKVQTAIYTFNSPLGLPTIWSSDRRLGSIRNQIAYRVVSSYLLNKIQL